MSKRLKGNIERVVLVDEHGNEMELDNGLILSDVGESVFIGQFNLSILTQLTLMAYNYSSITEELISKLGEDDEMVKVLQERTFEEMMRDILESEA